MARMTSTLSNGRIIFLSIFAEDLDRMQESDPRLHLYPSRRDYANSTAFFEAMVREGIIETDFSFFTAPRLPVSTGTYLLPEGNAWVVTADLDRDSPPDVPAMFTRNVDIDHLPPAGVAPPLSDEPPFGKRGCIVVYMGGSAKRLLADDLAQFNPSGQTNRVLRP